MKISSKSKTRLPMIHWDTLQENEKRCRSDNGETSLSRDGDAVYLHLRSDLAAAPDLAEALQKLLSAFEILRHGYQLQQQGEDLRTDSNDDDAAACFDEVETRKSDARAALAKAGL